MGSHRVGYFGDLILHVAELAFGEVDLIFVRREVYLALYIIILRKLRGLRGFPQLRGSDAVFHVVYLVS